MQLYTFVAISLVDMLVVFPGVWALFYFPDKKYQKKMEAQAEGHNGYTMRLSIMNTLGVGISALVTAGIFLIAVVWFDGVGEIAPFLIAVIVITICPLILIIYWFTIKVVVQADKFTVYKDFLKKKEISFSGVAEVRKSLQGLVLVDAQGKKLFSFDKSIMGFDLFVKNLQEKHLMPAAASEATAKTTAQLTEPVVIKQENSTKWFAFAVGIILFVGHIGIFFLLWPSLRSEPFDWISVLFYCFIAAELALGLWLCVYYFRWRLTIGQDSISVRKLGKEKTYHYTEFTRAIIQLGNTRGGVSIESLTLCIGKKKIVGVSEVMPGYAFLKQTVKEAGIPFFNR